MSSILGLGGKEQVDADTAVPNDGSVTGDVIDGAGSDTDTYNNSGANSTTYIDTDLGRVDNCVVVVHTQDTDIGTGVGVVIGEARPAVEGDFDTADDFVPGSILFTLADAADGTEIGDDTTIDDLQLGYVATRQ